MSDWARVIELANVDGEFRAKLIGDAVAACAEAGCKISQGMGIRVIQQWENEVHFILGTPTNVMEVDTLLEQAQSDMRIRNQLLQNATPILVSLVGHRFPKSTKFVVHERLPNETILVLRDEKDTNPMNETDRVLAILIGV